MNQDFYKLMLITHRQNRSLMDYLGWIEACVHSGITCIQLREKTSDAAFKKHFAQELKALLDPINIPLIINDDLNLALQVDAYGVHLGQSDACVQNARCLLGTDKAIGLSIESEHQLKQANNLDIQYVAASAVYPSAHKTDLKKIWGIEGVRKLSQTSIHPLIGIGGITIDNVAPLLEAGAKGVAVIGALHKALDPYQSGIGMRKLIDAGCPVIS